MGETEPKEVDASAAGPDSSGESAGAGLAAFLPSGVNKFIKSALMILAPGSVGLVVSLAFVLISGYQDPGKPVFGAISVPHDLEARGYTSDVMAHKIIDAYRDVWGASQTTMRSLSLVVNDSSGIQLKSDSNTVQMAAGIVLRLLHRSEPPEISGEITADRNGRLFLTLRYAGEALKGGTIGPSNTPDEMLQPAALAISRRVQPYVYASWLYRKKRFDEAEIEARSIIHSPLASSDESVMRSHILLGLIFQERYPQDLQSASNEFQRPIDAFPNSAIAAQGHNNLGALYQFDQTDNKRALQEYLKAAALDPNVPVYHNNLGYVYEQLDDLKNAIPELQRAITLDPKFSTPHYHLAVAYSRSKETDKAIDEHLAAIALDPEDTDSRLALARIFKQQADAATEEEDKERLLIGACSHLKNGAKFLPDDDEGYRQLIDEVDQLLKALPSQSGCKLVDN